MKYFPLLLALAFQLSCSSSPEREAGKDHFSGKKGCFLLYNVTTKKFEQEIGGETCRERQPACSTFKVPLAAMGFDAGVYKDPDQVLKWDGKARKLEQWNKDHTPRTWMRDSVVWVSQELTPKLGRRKFKNYLRSFDYGNQDISAGLTQAWLESPSKERALKISPYEQVAFMEKLWAGKLPISKRALEVTKEITYLETSPNGMKLNGKTGSNSFEGDGNRRLGWFIAHLEREGQEYIAVTQFTDLVSQEGQGYGGPAAKEITKNILAERGLW